MSELSPTTRDLEPASTSSSAIHILVVDDDENIRLALESYFELQGYRVTTAADGQTGMDLIAAHRTEYDLVLLDVMLPRKNGFEVLEETQKLGFTTPVLMMSGRGNQEDILKGFGLGAHDYIVKPFNADELVARVRAILGRTLPPAEAPMKTYQTGDLEINFTTFEAFRKEQRIELTELEFDLLRYLVQNRGQVVSRKRLLQDAWSIDQDLIMHTIDPDIVSAKLEENIQSIRHKIEPNPGKPIYLETVFGLGYRFNERLDGGRAAG